MKPFVLRGHERPINVVKFNYDGDLFFTGSAEKKVNMWESYTGERIGSFNTKSAIKSLDVDDNTKYMVTSSLDGTLEIFECQTGKSIKWFKFEIKVKYFEFALGDQIGLVLMDRFKADDSSLVHVYDFNTLLKAPNNKDESLPIKPNDIKPLLSFDTFDENGAKKIVTKISWYINNKGFFASTTDGFLLRYDSNGKLKAQVRAHENGMQIKSFSFAKDFSIIATAAAKGCRIFDPETFVCLKNFKQELPMNTVAISPLFCSEKNPKYHLVMGGGIPAREAALTGGSAGYQIHVCNIMFENELGSIAGHYGPVNSLDFFPDGRGFVSGGQEGISRVFRFDDSYWDDPKYE